MTAQVIDGHAVAKRLEGRPGRARRARRALRAGHRPGRRRLRGAGLRAPAAPGRGRAGRRLPAPRLGSATDQAAVERVVARLGDDPSVHGVLVLRPLPAHLDEGRVFQALHPENAGLLALGRHGWLDDVGEDRAAFYRRSTIAVVGRSNNVGKPAFALAFARQATVLSCDEWASRTGRLAELTRRADVLVVAAGVPGLIGAEHVADGAVVLDVGINPVTDDATGRVHLVGDVDLAAVDRGPGPSRRSRAGSGPSPTSG